MSEVSAPTPGKNSLADIPLLLRLPIQYWKQSVAVIVVILAVTGGYALVGVYQKSQSEKGEQALSKLVATTQGADRVTALEAMAKTAPSGVRDAVNLELAKYVNNRGVKPLNFKPEQEFKDPFGNQEKLTPAASLGLPAAKAAAKPEAKPETKPEPKK